MAFDALPIELNKAIAHYLETDKDLAVYRSICRSTLDAVDADNASFWRAKFREQFALTKGANNKALKRSYQRRAKLLRRGTGYDFFRGHKGRETDVVSMLKELIVESFSSPAELDEYGRPRCKNQTALLNFTLNSKILLNDRRAPPARGEPAHMKSDLAAVKLMLSQFLFELEGAKHNVFAFEETQRVVYMSSKATPLYRGLHSTELNMDWFLHCLSFFRHHMLNEEVGTLFNAVDELSAKQKPSAWQEPLRPGAYPLSSHWKGTYAFLDQPEIHKIRLLDEDQVGDEYFSDKNVDEGKIQSLKLDFLTDQPMRWPKIFEDRLQSLRKPPSDGTAKAQGRVKFDPKPSDSVQFIGTGVDLDDDFNAIGWLNPLPDQCQIPGWQRVTFMKHFMDDFDQVEQDNLWAYEGVVLPGGRIMLGRWWYASDEQDMSKDYNGPFIFWAVDEPDIEDNRDEE